MASTVPANRDDPEGRLDTLSKTKLSWRYCVSSESGAV